MASSTPANGNPYLAQIATLHRSIYPNVQAGFKNRLFGIIGLCCYLFAVTLAFLAVYTIVLRKQGKKPWAFRLVATKSGRYIVPNIYIAVVVPCLISSVLIGLLAWDLRSVYILQQSQTQAFLWRNVIWIVPWSQGWIAVVANLTAALLVASKESKPFFLRPNFVNSVYILFPIGVLIAILVPGILASHHWDNLYQMIQNAISILSAAAENFTATGNLDSSINATLLALSMRAREELDSFSHDYVLMLGLWTFASFMLVAVNLSAIPLVMRLRRQLKYSANPTATFDERPPVFAIQRLPETAFAAADVRIPSPGASNPNSEDLKNEEIFADGVAFKLEQTPAAATTTDHVTRRISITSAPRRPSMKPSINETLSRYAMRKLVRDLLFSTTAVSGLAAIFAADTIFIAVRRKDISRDGNLTELATTLICWAYLIGASLAMTAVLVNEVTFLIRMSKPTQTGTVTLQNRRASSFSGAVPRSGGETSTRSHNGYDTPPRVALQNAVEVTTVREITVEHDPDEEFEPINWHPRRASGPNNASLVNNPARLSKFEMVQVSPMK